MVRAVWNGAVVAESDRTVKLEGHHYFPARSLRREYFTASPTSSTCPWKGRASYYHVTVDGQVNRDAAWYYPHPSAAADQIAGYVAFWRGVRIERVPGPDGEAAGGAGRGLAGRIRGPAVPGRNAAVSPAAGAPGGVLVYWRPGCPYCSMLRLGLRSAQVRVTWVNIWEDRAAAARVRVITGGDETVPTVIVGDRSMVNPSARQVIAAVGGGQPGTGRSAGTGAATRLARLTGFLSRRPGLGSPR